MTALRFAGFYGIALSLLIFTWLFTPMLIELFTAEPYSLGSHGLVWQYWHAVGCGFAGVVNLRGARWDPRSQRELAIITGGLYLAWAAENLYFTTMTSLFDPFMWSHVVLCSITGAWCLVASRSHAS
jgi:hypothetical protein